LTVTDAPRPNKQELLRLLDKAREALQESQRHWGAVVGLTGDRRYQRQQREAVELLERCAVESRGLRSTASRLG
jgi:hypothetical protein